MIAYSRPRTGCRRLLTAGVLFFLVSACGDSSDAEQDFYVDPEMPENPVARTEAAAAELAGRDQFPTTSRVDSVDGSGTVGQVTTVQRNDEFVVLVELEGLPEPVEYGAHIHRGVCAEGGAVAVLLNPVVGLADGTGSSTTTLGSDEVSPAEPLFVQIHGGDGVPLACGDLVESES